MNLRRAHNAARKDSGVEVDCTIGASPFIPALICRRGLPEEVHTQRAIAFRACVFPTPHC